MTKSELISDVEGFFDKLDAADLATANPVRLNILDLIRRNKLDSAIDAFSKISAKIGTTETVSDMVDKVTLLKTTHDSIKAARALAKENEPSVGTEPRPDSK